jgi:hypothetical protein
MSLGSSSATTSPFSSSVPHKDGDEDRSSTALTAANGPGSYSNGQKRKRNKPTLNCGACVDRKVSKLSVEVFSKAEGNPDRQNVTGRNQNAAPAFDVRQGASIKKDQHPLGKARRHSAADPKQLSMVSRYVIVGFKPGTRPGRRHATRSYFSAGLSSAQYIGAFLPGWLSLNCSRFPIGSEAL